MLTIRPFDAAGGNTFDVHGAEVDIILDESFLQLALSFSAAIGDLIKHTRYPGPGVRRRQATGKVGMRRSAISGFFASLAVTARQRAEHQVSRWKR